jgi:hypothetical protein
MSSFRLLLTRLKSLHSKNLYNENYKHLMGFDLQPSRNMQCQAIELVNDDKNEKQRLNYTGANMFAYILIIKVFISITC